MRAVTFLADNDVRLLEIRPNGSIERLRLADCAHSPHRDRPDAVLRAITDFLAPLD